MTFLNPLQPLISSLPAALPAPFLQAAQRVGDTYTSAGEKFLLSTADGRGMEPLLRKLFHIPAIDLADISEILGTTLLVGGIGMAGGCLGILFTDKFFNWAIPNLYEANGSYVLAHLRRFFAKSHLRETSFLLDLETCGSSRGLQKAEVFRRRLRDNPLIRDERVRSLDDNPPGSADDRRIGELLHSFGRRLEFAEFQLLRLMASQWVAETQPLIGTRLAARAEQMIRNRKDLGKANAPVSMGGKIRWKREGHYAPLFPGYPEGFQPILSSEARPLLLWPTSNPSVLVETIMRILQKAAATTGEGVPVSISFSVGGSLGGVSEDLKEAALAVHAVAPIPFRLGRGNAENRAGLRWFAPVVDGGTGHGAMQHIPRRNFLDRDIIRRYDYLFLAFDYPPTEGLPASGEWRARFEQFLAESGLTITKAEPGSRTVRFSLSDRKGNIQDGVWNPSTREWQALRHGPMEEGLFLYLARITFLQDLNRVAETVWALGILREANFVEKKDILDRRLADLWHVFNDRMRQQLQEERLGGILETRWVDGDWEWIADDFERYQSVLENNPARREAIRNIAAETVQAVRQLLTKNLS